MLPRASILQNSYRILMDITSFCWMYLNVLRLDLYNDINNAEAAAIRVLMRAKRDLYYMVEQPSQSWAFKASWMKGIACLGSLCFACLIYGALRLFFNHFKSFSISFMDLFYIHHHTSTYYIHLYTVYISIIII